MWRVRDAYKATAVTRVGENRYVYDANSNMTERIQGGKCYQQTWTVGNKLASVRWEDRGWKCQVRFGYDGEGVRLWKREYLPRPLGVVVRLTLYAGYGFEEGYVEEVQSHAAGAGEPPSDVCGKVEGVTDLGFTGQRQEISFGLYDYKARYFSPALGRFISPDSIVPNYSNPQSLNRYAYVYNNPVRYTDSTGHQCDTCDLPWQILGEELYDIWQGGILWWQEDVVPAEVTQNQELVQAAWEQFQTDGTMSIHAFVSGSAFGGEGGSYIGLVHMDEKGNLAIGTLAFVGGGDTTWGIDVGGSVLLTNAADISELQGGLSNTGAIFAFGNASGGVDVPNNRSRNGHLTGAEPWLAGSLRIPYLEKVKKFFTDLKIDINPIDYGLHTNFDYTIPYAVFSRQVDENGDYGWPCFGCHLNFFNEEP